ncbi:hypothetical protein [Isoalcanivorax beigongshangi]|uniref:Uncharacterized protein n=1 Tax=Isoalcanivorax beigongshangi TaxID=3238810 RepID=A0ABV4AGR7_9GAMM
MDLMWMLAIAATSSLLTLVLLAAWLTLVVRPRMAREIRGLLTEQAEKAAETIAAEVEAAVRRGIVGGVTALPTREVLQGTTRNIARTSVEIVEERLGQLFGKRRPRDED